MYTLLQFSFMKRDIRQKKSDKKGVRTIIFEFKSLKQLNRSSRMTTIRIVHDIGRGSMHRFKIYDYGISYTIIIHN